ncbi:putative lipoprotein [Cystobacter fuscus DSM 2262]|uniref:Lipoprotein n=1 Tax=Cystobacter fuscus (strain ATCC 25194 / DSM 2262 / NBRC 100088 / M29) TaxID=1242864 RepID=S9P974_CYSF2|nr:hypothetical protein [Cystobacter fuscus]EPX60975.1 putative lipoprotein [Cystobacter fuscus DSM 2262]
MPALARALLLTTLALLASGCRKIADTFFVVTAETDQICQSESGVSFSGAAPGQETLERTLEVPLGQIGQDLPAGRVDTDLSLQLFTLEVTGGDADLSKLQTVKVSLRRQGSTELIRTLLEYSQPSQAFSEKLLALRAVEATSVPDLARDERLELVLEARGTLPAQAWTANLRACVGVRAEVHAFKFIF